MASHLPLHSNSLNNWNSCGYSTKVLNNRYIWQMGADIPSFTQDPILWYKSYYVLQASLSEEHLLLKRNFHSQKIVGSGIEKSIWLQLQYNYFNLNKLFFKHYNFVNIHQNIESSSVCALDMFSKKDTPLGCGESQGWVFFGVRGIPRLGI